VKLSIARISLETKLRCASRQNGWSFSIVNKRTNKPRSYGV